MRWLSNAIDRGQADHAAFNDESQTSCSEKEAVGTRAWRSKMVFFACRCGGAEGSFQKFSPPTRIHVSHPQMRR